MPHAPCIRHLRMLGWLLGRPLESAHDRASHTHSFELPAADAWMPYTCRETLLHSASAVLQAQRLVRSALWQKCLGEHRQGIIGITGRLEPRTGQAQAVQFTVAD